MSVFGVLLGWTMAGLGHLYPRVSPGGFVIVDDYGNIEACKAAVHDYRARYGITELVVDVDGSGVWWRRQSSDAKGPKTVVHWRGNEVNCPLRFV